VSLPFRAYWTKTAAAQPTDGGFGLAAMVYK
jgi:hypothetical protein